MVTINIVNGPQMHISCTSKINLQHALEIAYETAPHGTFSYALQYYGDQLGYLVSMINGTYESFNPKEKPYFFWEVLINGTVAPKGIDNTFLKNGDTVTFDFIPYTPGITSESTTHIKYQFATSELLLAAAN